MSQRAQLDFGGDSVALAYEEGLVPVLFEPWARQLVNGNRFAWKGRRVLDLGAGTGIVTRLLLGKVGATGHVVAADMSAEMLAEARLRVRSSNDRVEFVEAPADALPLPPGSADVVVCQQAFQFFPDKPAAVAEIRRVLPNGGQVFVATWLPVEQCEYFGVVCDALEAIGQDELSTALRTPFDFMPARELAWYFEAAGFSDVEVVEEALPLTLPGGLAQAIEVAHSTPIGPKLGALPDADQKAFSEAMRERVRILSKHDTDMGMMRANVLSARKPS